MTERQETGVADDWQASRSARRASMWGLAGALGVLTATVWLGWLLVRDLARSQIAQRDAEALYATTLLEQLELADQELSGLKSDEQLGFDAAVRASRLKGVMGIRFYDPSGTFKDAFPPTVLPVPLEADAMHEARRFRPRGRFRPNTRMSDIFIYLARFSTEPIAVVPTLEITVPLHSGARREIAGIAQFIVEGASIAEEYARMNRWLATSAALTLLVASAVLLALLVPALVRAERLRVTLASRSERLARANKELALATRASAIGAISAHLMHGLKNPLASLSDFVSAHDGGSAHEGISEWDEAMAATRRMQSLVERTIEVIGDARGDPPYETTASEVLGDILKEASGCAKSRQVEVTACVHDDFSLDSRAGNIVRLILQNLVDNAIEVTPSGGRVTMGALRADGCMKFTVRDGGPGFPEHLRKHLFLPCKSTRVGGSGVGLAISKQLADSLRARLELSEPAEGGCEWLLELSAEDAAGRMRPSRGECAGCLPPPGKFCNGEGA